MEGREDTLEPGYNHCDSGEKQSKYQKPQWQPVDHEGQVKLELRRMLYRLRQDHQSCTHRTSAVLSRLLYAKAEVRFGCFLWSNRDSHRLLAHLLVNRRQSVCSCRQPADGEVAFGIGHGKKRRRRNVDERVHPRMIVAPYRDHHFGLVELFYLWCPLRPLRDVDRQAALCCRQCMDVVH